MNKELKDKLANLPSQPGVYFHKDIHDEIIYVGKAAVLRNRVRHYFQKSQTNDLKTQALIAEINDTDWMVVDSEIEALFLEAEMIQRYKPRYNILLRDDKSMVYIRVDYDSDFPTVSLTRQPLDDGARYFGPYLSAQIVRNALKALRRVFPFAMSRSQGQKRATLFYYLGLDPGLEEGRTSLKEYRGNLRKLMAVIGGQRQDVESQLDKEMKKAAEAKDFEKAAKIRNQLFALKNLSRKVIFSDKEFLDINKDHALNELTSLLSLAKVPRRIEGYDISHMQGTDVVASMVVFTNGLSDKSQYRKFKTKKEQNNDFDNMSETILRRLSNKNVKAWGKPDLVLIDGGKGQLEAAITARDAAGFGQISFIGLAKREEQIVIEKGRSNAQLDLRTLHQLGGFVAESGSFILVNLPHNTNLVKFLQRVRDESHRFAVSYHSILKSRRQTSSLLENIPGIGPSTRKKLLKEFGSWRSLSQTDELRLSSVIGTKKASLIKLYLMSRDNQNLVK